MPPVLAGGVADLPAPKGAVTGADDPFGGIDLPAPVQGGEADLPAPKGATDDPFGGIDLPTPVGGGEADLPAPKSATDDPFGGIDLPTPVGGGEADLPAPKASDDPFGGIDLPTPAASGGVDLPGPRGEDAFGEIDLPTVSSAETDFSDVGPLDSPGVRGDIPAPNPQDPFGEIDLPTPSGSVDLPAPSGGVDLPAPSGAVDLPTPSGATDLPAPRDEDPFGEIDLPTPSGASDLPQPAGTTDLPEPIGGVTDVPSSALPSPGDLGPPPALGSPSAGDSLGPPPVGGDPRQRVQSSGSTDFGEIDLSADPGDGEEHSLSGEFDEFPTSNASSKEKEPSSLDLGEPAPSGGKGTFIDDAPAQEGPGSDGRKSGVKYEGRRKLERQSRKLKIALLAVVVLLGFGGAALSFTPLGAFGSNAIADLLPSSSAGKVVDQLRDKTNKRVQEDTFTSLNEAIKELDMVRKDYKDDEDLRLLGVYLHNWHQIRFGNDKKHNSASTKLLGKINLGESGSRFSSIASQSRDLNALKVAKVIQENGSKSKLSPNSTAILAEAHLLEGNFEDATKVAKRLMGQEKSARASFLHARCLTRTGKSDEAEALLKAMLKSHPKHLGGRLLLAQMLIQKKGRDEAEIMGHLETVTKSTAKTSTDIQRARGHSLIGSLHLKETRYAKATGEFDLAESQNPNDLVLLVGRGNLALLSDDLAAAHSFFMRARSEDPTDLEARLGQADAMIRQGVLADAKALLAELLPDNGNNAVAHYLMGKVETSLKNTESGEKELGKAIALAKDFIEPYIALSELYIKTGRDSQAMRTLDEAADAVPTSPLIKLSIADGHAARGDLSSAIVALDEALLLDPNNIRCHFKMAQMYRKMGSLDDARRALDEVSARNANHPGLALEQGFLMEMSGKVEEALTAYERVLAASPDDNGAKIRVGAASLLAGNSERARKLLGEALAALPKSAEANYYMGESFRVEGKPSEASIYLKTAKDLDDGNPRYHLRYGMALMSLRDMANATTEFNRARELDPKMAETHVRIGEIKLRTGSARDAIKSLDKALELDPKMDEAYGLIGEAFEELADLRSSLAYYRRAVTEIPENAKMHFRLALTQLQIGGNKAAMGSLETSVELAEKLEEKPNWLPEAYYRLGVAQMGQGQKGSAVASFKRYLEIAPDKALDRSEVLAHLERLQD